ncbi:MAG: hypothetical protein ACD_68C00043G0006 [uncultured bacterium]|nr:MAG: hypothetical protein ACD_68C00043G0006 [uncultured bacterium]
MDHGLEMDQAIGVVKDLAERAHLYFVQDIVYWQEKWQGNVYLCTFSTENYTFSAQIVVEEQKLIITGELPQFFLLFKSIIAFEVKRLTKEEIDKRQISPVKLSQANPLARFYFTIAKLRLNKNFKNFAKQYLFVMIVIDF